MICALDEARSVAFYKKAFGLEVAERLEFPDFALVDPSNAESPHEVELTINKDRAEPYDLGDGYGQDKWGLPVASVHFDDHPNDAAMRNHAFRQGKALYEAVGATRVFPTPPYPSTHNLGTNRMSENPRDGGVNKHGQTHDIKNLCVSDGSKFTTGGAENPTLTIVTLAIRQTDYIAEQMKANAI